jgi:hypothetical protein
MRLPWNLLFVDKFTVLITAEAIGPNLKKISCIVGLVPDGKSRGQLACQKGWKKCKEEE